MANSDTRPALLRLAPGDNVLVAVRTLEAGAKVEIDGVRCAIGSAINFGHKVAASGIRAGEKIVKCRFPIGSATCDIAAGEHVHLHNMKSDYLPTFVRSDMGEAGDK